MAQQAFKLKVIGIPYIPSVTQINARPDAGTNQDLVFKIDVGTTDILIIDVKEDVEGKNLDGKVYQWFRAQFAQGVAWVRDDLVEVWGDGTTIGYPVVNTPTLAHGLTRQVGTIAPGEETQSAPTTLSEVSATPSASSEVSAAPSTSSEVSAAPSTSSEVSAAPVSVAPSGPGMAKAMSSFPAKLRPGPSTGHNPPVTSLQYGQTGEVLETAKDDSGKSLYWVKVRFNGQEGWTREDLVRLSGNFPSFSLNAPDKYPSPAPESSWIRGWDQDGSIWNTGKHHGWDHAGAKGNPLNAGPKGGVIFRKEICSKCGAQGASTLERGLQLYDSSVYKDPAWNYGYGHYIIIGYENSVLPASTQQYLQSIGRGGQHIFVMYAHCQDLSAEAGQTVGANQQIATIGNSGNSTGAHLHLEVRISDTMSPPSWAELSKGLSSPGILFLR